MDNQYTNQSFKLSTDKSLLVASFLAVMMFAVLITIVQIINRGEQYTQTQSQAQEPVGMENTAEDISEMESEITEMQQELQQDAESNLEPELDIDLELAE